ncbi:MAG TPA: carboxypeptidase-like regulatory domain-containing protein [Rhodothermales bacterium]|nr:carboxypeptidase-like regulatory domain-containing protein [Rhodothermales bacterium]
MNRAFWLLLTTAVVGSILGAGCLGEAPRDNPFDPGSDLFRNEGTVSGQVLRRDDTPIADVEVRLIPDSSRGGTVRVARTGSQGRFLFEGAPAATNYTLQAEKTNFSIAVREALEVRAGESEEVPPLHLNALPIFNEVAVRSLHISRWWPEDDLFFLEVTAEVSDADGLIDLDRVWLDVPDLGFTVPLEARSEGQFDQIITADSLPASNPQALLGRPLFLLAQDREGVMTQSNALQLARIIEETPVATSPKDRVLLTDNRPLFTWDPFVNRFPFTYRIDIFRTEVNRDVLVTQQDGFSMNTTTFQLQTSLETGEYFWTVAVVDGFGNESRSKEAGFRVP